MYVKPATRSHEPDPGIISDDDGKVLQCNVGDQPKNLASYESAIVRFTKLDKENGDLRTPGIALFNPRNVSKIKLAPGKYSFDIMLLRNERYNGEMTIEKESQKKVIEKGFGQEETIYYPEEDISLPSIYSGGAIFEWDVGAQELENANIVTFYIFDEGAPELIEDIAVPLKHREPCSQMNNVRPRLQ